MSDNPETKVMNPDFQIKMGVNDPHALQVPAFLVDTFVYKYYRRWRYNRQYLPHNINLEVTGDCNLGCRMCNWRGIERRRGIVTARGRISMETLNNLLRGIPPSTPIEFDISGGGEPTLHPELPRIIARIREHLPKASLLLSTNGVLFTPELSRELLREGLDTIVLSLVMPNRELYHWMAGQDLFQQVLDNMEFIVAEQRRLGKVKPYLSVLLINFAESNHLIKDFIEQNRERLGNINVRPLDEQDREVLLNNQVQMLDRNRYAPFIGKDLSGMRYPCSQPWQRAFVGANGDVAPCVQHAFEGHPIGNINQTPLPELFQSEAWNQFRQHHLDGDHHKIAGCENCKSWMTRPNVWFQTGINERGQATWR